MEKDKAEEEHQQKLICILGTLCIFQIRHRRRDCMLIPGGKWGLMLAFTLVFFITEYLSDVPKKQVNGTG